MKTLTFLGTGSALGTGGNWHSNMLFQDSDNEDGVLLIDCGGDIRHSMDAAGFDVTSVDAVYISHMHGDHTGGLEWLGYASYFNPKYEGKPTLIAFDYLIDQIWQKLEPAMKYLDDKIATLEDYFNVMPVSIDPTTKTASFMWGETPFLLVPSRHVDIPGDDKMYSFGLSFMTKQELVWITTDSCEANFADNEKWWDSKPKSDMPEAYKEHTLIFHDCETINASKVHSHYDNLKKFPTTIKEKMWLYHYQSHAIPNAEADGFAGLVKKNETFLLED